MDSFLYIDCLKTQELLWLNWNYIITVFLDFVFAWFDMYRVWCVSSSFLGLFSHYYILRKRRTFLNMKWLLGGHYFQCSTRKQISIHWRSRNNNIFLYPQLAEELLSKEVLNYDDIVTILGPCPFGDKRVRFSSPEAAAQSQSLFSGWF